MEDSQPTKNQIVLEQMEKYNVRGIKFGADELNPDIIINTLSEVLADDLVKSIQDAPVAN